MGSIPSTGTHHASTGMTGRTAQVQSADRRSMICPTWNRSHHMELVEIHGTLKNIATRKPIRSLNVDRAQHLPMLDRIRNIGRILSKSFQTTIRK
jgi:hypothetical protein